MQIILVEIKISINKEEDGNLLTLLLIKTQLKKRKENATDVTLNTAEKVKPSGKP